ncbi:hypothetical protein [Tropicibacter oceani]|uniref:Uncharacterized protein n=1 Tax=Tropicibacter oceani TaxID=3058420 RepID=A0ABY8QEX6_9RHOB|nr:hypothetical protein [Tropicibacter oceani]WGW03176.1 hypothetical protein QF118_14765 [Tropicibacter oceani]
MPDPSPQDLDRIARERQEMLRPQWLLRLFRGDLPLGETFWGGHLGLQLVLMPLWLTLIMVVPLVVPGLRPASLMLFFGLTLALSVGVTRAVILVAPRAGKGGWRWIAVLVSLVITAQHIWLLSMWLRGDL